MLWPSKTANRLKGGNSPLTDVMEIKGCFVESNVSFKHESLKSQVYSASICVELFLHLPGNHHCHLQRSTVDSAGLPP